MKILDPMSDLNLFLGEIPPLESPEFQQAVEKVRQERPDLLEVLLRWHDAERNAQVEKLFPQQAKAAAARRTWYQWVLFLAYQQDRMDGSYYLDKTKLWIIYFAIPALAILGFIFTSRMRINAENARIEARILDQQNQTENPAHSGVTVSPPSGQNSESSSTSAPTTLAGGPQQGGDSNPSTPSSNSPLSVPPGNADPFLLPPPSTPTGSSLSQNPPPPPVYGDPVVAPSSLNSGRASASSGTALGERSLTVSGETLALSEAVAQAPLELPPLSASGPQSDPGPPLATGGSRAVAGENNPRGADGATVVAAERGNAVVRADVTERNNISATLLGQREQQGAVRVVQGQPTQPLTLGAGGQGGREGQAVTLFGSAQRVEVGSRAFQGTPSGGQNIQGPQNQQGGSGNQDGANSGQAEQNGQNAPSQNTQNSNGASASVQGHGQAASGGEAVRINGQPQGSVRMDGNRANGSGSVTLFRQEEPRPQPQTPAQAAPAASPAPQPSGPSPQAQPTQQIRTLQPVSPYAAWTEIGGRIMVGAVVAANMPRFPVMVKAADGSVWSGAASLNNDRVYGTFDRVYTDGQIHVTRALLVTKQGATMNWGVQAKLLNPDADPNFFERVVSGLLRGLVGYVDMYAKASSTTLVPGAGVTTSSSAPSLGVAVFGGVAQEFVGQPRTAREAQRPEKIYELAGESEVVLVVVPEGFGER